MAGVGTRAVMQGGGGKGVTNIVWDATKRRFATEDGLAYLEYKLRGSNSKGKQVMDVVHTYVPAKKRGLGIAGELCKAAFIHAKDHDMLVIPTCTYVSVSFTTEYVELLAFLMVALLGSKKIWHVLVCDKDENNRKLWGDEL